MHRLNGSNEEITKKTNSIPIYLISYNVIFFQSELQALPGWSDSKVLTCVRAQVNGELAGVAAGIGTDLAFKGPLVVVDPEVFLQAAAVCGRIQAVFAFVRLLTRV